MAERKEPRGGIAEQSKERSPFEFYKLSPSAKGRLMGLGEYGTVTSLVIGVLKKHPKEYLTADEVFGFWTNNKAGDDCDRNLRNSIASALEYLVGQKLAVTKGATIYGKRGIRK